MNEELNIDEFDNWLKNQADKHRMYPSDQLWRNINQQLHEQRRWPALTFGAILTGALVTAAFIFLDPHKDIFTLPSAYSTSTGPIAVQVKERSRISSSKDVLALKPVNPKEAIYSFNYTVAGTPPADATDRLPGGLPEERAVVYTERSDADEITVPVACGSTTPVRSTVVSVIPHSSVTLEDHPVPASPDGVNAKPAINTPGAMADEAEGLDAITETTRKLIRLPNARKNRRNVEIYGGSNINYRRLTEPSSFDYHLPYNQTLSSSNRNKVNDVIKQRPSVGFNVGAAFTYALSSRLKVKTGLQFNFRQYNIDAFQSKYERSVLLMNNGFIYPDSVYMYSVISNEQGNHAITLSNRYYQISTPVSLEWTAFKLQKIRLNLAANVQPTYQLNSDVYLITSDYKSYVQAPGLLRRWNINAGAEATASFDAGGLQWQVGPQILYQTMPTQKNNYSIQEHLVDYGIRIGIIKQLY